ncbi:MAG: DUF6364 family protein [Candidatus Desulfofervidaceae bacterium]|nr:DUF6364 family protein [Candidatus Desulfofervidaceae bacterium]
MPNLTISIPDHLLEKARKYAAQRGTSLNNLLREYLEELVGLNKEQLKKILNDLLELSDRHTGKLERWKREDLYDRQV